MMTSQGERSGGHRTESKRPHPVTRTRRKSSTVHDQVKQCTSGWGSHVVPLLLVRLGTERKMKVTDLCTHHFHLFSSRLNGRKCKLHFWAEKEIQHGLLLYSTKFHYHTYDNRPRQICMNKVINKYNTCSWWETTDWRKCWLHWMELRVPQYEPAWAHIYRVYAYRWPSHHFHQMPGRRCVTARKGQLLRETVIIWSVQLITWN